MVVRCFAQAPLVLRLQRGAGLQQGADGRLLSERAGDVQRSATLDVGGVGVRGVPQQEADDVLASGHAGVEERRFAGGGKVCAGTRPVVKEQRDRGDLSGREGLHIRTVLNEELGDVRVPLLGSEVQRCPAALGSCIDISPVLQQQLSDFVVAIIGGEVQRGVFVEGGPHVRSM